MGWDDSLVLNADPGDASPRIAANSRYYTTRRPAGRLLDQLATPYRSSLMAFFYRYNLQLFTRGKTCRVKPPDFVIDKRLMT
ncbi:hypothetical protein KCP76_17340 [Salmonella enterica subsp. enterica serovar Weltevreden]|nr:hypothetical protein KCP76_17340 [Salmonella enterica subsp. enterica serovar Weltevreden]